MKNQELKEQYLKIRERNQKSKLPFQYLKDKTKALPAYYSAPENRFWSFREKVLKN